MKLIASNKKADYDFEFSLKLDAGLVYAALQLAIENNRLSQKTKNASSDTEQRIEEISEKLNIFLNQQ